MNKIKDLSKWLLAAVICSALFRKRGEWEDSLIWCPSQCFLNFTIGKKHYVLYLRWRWEDPWTADLIETDETFALQGDRVMWRNLNIKYFSENDDLGKLKRHSIRKAILKVAHCI
jgi:hypothetical protein